MYASAVPWTGLTEVPSGFADGTDEKLTEAEVETFVTNDPLDLASSTTLRGTGIASQSPSLKLISTVKGYASTTGSAGRLKSLTLQVMTRGQEAVSLETSTIAVTYQDDNQKVSVAQSAGATPKNSTAGWFATYLVGSGPVLDQDEVVEILVNLTGLLSVELTTSTSFRIEIRPQGAAPLVIERKTPGEITSVNTMPFVLETAPLELTSEATAHATSSLTFIDYLTFNVSNSSGPELPSHSLSAPFGIDAFVTYIDEN